MRRQEPFYTKLSGEHTRKNSACWVSAVYYADCLVTADGRFSHRLRFGGSPSRTSTSRVRDTAGHLPLCCSNNVITAVIKTGVLALLYSCLGPRARAGSQQYANTGEVQDT